MPEKRRISFANAWGLRKPWEMIEYARAAALRSDVVCLSEVTHLLTPCAPPATIYTSSVDNELPSHLDGLAQLRAGLGPEYLFRYAVPQYLTRTCAKGREYTGTGFGSVLIHHKGLAVVGYGHYDLQFNSPTVSDRVLQWLVYDKSRVRYLVGHLHGVWIAGNTKGDHPYRELQSRLVLRWLSDMRAAFGVKRTIFGGDLNLGPDTNALRLLETPAHDGVALVNLIRKRQVRGTRTKLYREYGRPGYEHADYVFVSPDVAVHALGVDTFFEGSDHAPLEVMFL